MAGASSRISLCFLQPSSARRNNNDFFQQPDQLNRRQRLYSRLQNFSGILQFHSFAHSLYLFENGLSALFNLHSSFSFSHISQYISHILRPSPRSLINPIFPKRNLQSLYRSPNRIHTHMASSIQTLNSQLSTLILSTSLSSALMFSGFWLALSAKERKFAKGLWKKVKGNNEPQYEA